jgi:hypothetical protein
MLRRGKCYPVSENDANNIAYNVVRLTPQEYKELRSVNLVGNIQPDLSGWQSFGWAVDNSFFVS